MGSRGTRSITGARAVGAVLTVPAVAGAVAVTTLTGYLGLLSVCGTVVQRRRERHSTNRPPAPLGAVRFAILVPAHDEGAGIGRAVQGMLSLDYPRSSYEVHVVADNCTDDTAAVVRALGATAHERTDPTHPGKGAALNWLHDRLVTAQPTFDAYVIVDADTTLDAMFLAEMERAVSAGASAAQGFYDVRDAAQSATAGLRAAALACRHHLRPLGRKAIGGSCGLFGNGMVFTAPMLAERRWSGHLTEDLEFQMELLLEGHLVTYVPGAQLEAEMPHELEASVTQNQRWERGRVEVARSYLPKLVRALLAGRASRVATADAIADQLVPPVSVLAAAQIAVDVASLAALVVAPSRGRRLLLVIDVLSTAALVGHVLAGLRSVGAPASVYRSMGQAPKMLIWKLRLWLGVLGADSEVTWSRTERNVTSESNVEEPV